MAYLYYPEFRSWRGELLICLCPGDEFGSLLFSAESFPVDFPRFGSGDVEAEEEGHAVTEPDVLDICAETDHCDDIASAIPI